MNFIPARLTGQGESMSLVLDGGVSLPLPREHAGAIAGWNGREVLLGLRPEHMQRPGSAGAVPLSVHVELAQPTGPRTYIEFRLGGVVTVAEVGAHDVHRAGDKANLALDMQRAIIVDPDTEKVLSSGSQ